MDSGGRPNWGKTLTSCRNMTFFITFTDVKLAQKDKLQFLFKTGLQEKMKTRGSQVHRSPEKQFQSINT